MGASELHFIKVTNLTASVQTKKLAMFVALDSLHKSKGTIKEVPFSLLKTEEMLMSARVRCNFVVVDDIDTDQIIPAEYLTLVPSKPEEYEKLGSYALVGLPDRYGKFITPGETKTLYPIIVAGENFGCGSSRNTHLLPWGLRRKGSDQSYARIFPQLCGNR